MKKKVYTTLLSTGLVFAMSTQAFAAANLDETAPDKNVTVGNAVTTSIAVTPTTETTSVDTATTLTTKLTKKEVTPTAFAGATPTNMYEIYYSDINGKEVLLETIMVFDQAEYMNNLTKVARPTPYMVIDGKAYVSMQAENPFAAGSTDYKNFEELSDESYPVIENQITDMSIINGAFSTLLGGDIDYDALDDFIYIQDLKTDKMTTVQFDMYAPKTKDSNEYDLLAKVTYKLDGTVEIKVPMKQDVAIDPAFYMMQRLLLNNQQIAESAVVNDGVVYVPVRDYADITGYEVIYLPQSNTINLKKGNTKFVTRYGGDYATKMVNGEVVSQFDLENPLYIVDGTGYVPLNFVVQGINS